MRMLVVWSDVMASVGDLESEADCSTSRSSIAVCESGSEPVCASCVSSTRWPRQYPVLQKDVCGDQLVSMKRCVLDSKMSKVMVEDSSAAT